MAISVFDIFTVGIGPSSSHTVGPMRAAKAFLLNLNSSLSKVHRVETTLYGSLAFTGRGHGTYKAVIMGLMGQDPETIDPNIVASHLHAIQHSQHFNLLGEHRITFSIEKDILFNYKKTPDYHPNAMQFVALDSNKNIIDKETYYSVGGGFIVNEKDIHTNTSLDESELPYPFQTAADLLAHCSQHQLSIADIMLANEKISRTEKDIKTELLTIASVMEACIEK